MSESGSKQFRVVIAGGGVAAIEGLLALRHLAGDAVASELVAPDPSFRYRPLSVTEPFDLAAPRHLDLSEIVLENGATFMCDAVVEVRPGERRAVMQSGRELDYDALLIAIGARGVDAIPGALSFRDSTDQDRFRGVLEELRAGAARRLAFVVPPGGSWPLGLYELALLTAADLARHAVQGAELTLVTPEVTPMEIFGKKASAAVASMLDQAGIDVRTSTRAERFEDGALTVVEGEQIVCDRVVALPEPQVPPLAGVPQQRGGFIPVDRYGGVLGVERVYAAGDSTWFPVKQGGLATQQADCAASAIAALAGAKVDPQPFRPVLRGALLTDFGPRYMRKRLDQTGDEAASQALLWWPPAKVAGKYLAPYLAAQAGYAGGHRPLSDLQAPPADLPANLDTGHEDVVAIALSSARARADARDYHGALRWLEVAEDLDLYLPKEYELKRVAWQTLEGRNPA